MANNETLNSGSPHPIGSSVNLSDDPTNKYYLHHGDSPSAILSSLKMSPCLLIMLGFDATPWLKSLWDELNNFRSILDCSCGALKIVLDNKQHEYVMQFLMGLNDSFSHVRAQILMTDPFPPITEAFALVVQEERQRNINIPFLAPGSDSVALFTRGEAPRNNL
uniref:Uncharacterized protein n=1 Tax=Fagus sylvatica TaxID=28930 RepID=A0A2N9GCW0_FAGSY